MKKILILSIGFGMVFSACETFFYENEPSTDPWSIFQQTWEFTDREYSFFEYKNIDWDSAYDVYQDRIYPEMDEKELFDVLAEMLFLLKDGHVNLKSPFDRSRNWFWYLDYPVNYDFSSLQRQYFKSREQYAGPFIIMDFDDVGYIHYRSFSNTVSEENMDYVIDKFRNQQGLIIDVRSNGGGSMSNAVRIARRFTDKKTLAVLRQDKTGPGHNDFTDKYEVYLEPPEDKEIFLKPVVILSNRLAYSATNYMIALMRELPNVTVIGDSSGGGGGIPAYTELSNGWLLRVSSTRMYTPGGFNIENGIPPDVKVDITDEDKANNVDTILEFALEFTGES